MRRIVTGLGIAAVAAAWTPQAASATPVDCRPGSGPPCGQAFFQIDKVTGKVVAALALPGGNQEGADFDGLDCQTGRPGQCFLAADRQGFLLMTFGSFTCDPKTATTPIGTAALPTIDTMAFDPANGRLYAVVGSQLKVVDQATGALTDTSAWLGVASGASGDEELAHVTAVTFDPATGNLFGTVAAFSTGVLGLAALVRPLIVDSAASFAFLAAAALYTFVSTTFLWRGRAGRLAGLTVLGVYGIWLVLAARN